MTKVKQYFSISWLKTTKYQHWIKYFCCTLKSKSISNLFTILNSFPPYRTSHCTSGGSAGRLSLHIYVAGSVGLSRLQWSGWLQFQLGGRGVELGRWRLHVRKELGLGERGLELRHRGLQLSWGLGGWRLELGTSSRGWRILTALFGPTWASQARQQLGERVRVNRATRYLREGNQE